MVTPRNISGFIEWLPWQKKYEEELVFKLKNLFQSHCYLPLETSAVELVDTLSAKGVIDKEIYGLCRLGSGEASKDIELALHFDLTVPFARYISQHLNDITLPFKRYQIQKVWRGERAQKGRFREFYQCDVDIVANEKLPFWADAEILKLFNKGLAIVSPLPYKIKLNHRKILNGILESLSIDIALWSEVAIVLDKLEKVGIDKVIALLEGLGIDSSVAKDLVSICQVSASISDIFNKLDGLGIKSGLFLEGIEELKLVLDILSGEDNLLVDLSLVRGLDYYTGVVMEAVMDNYESFGSIGGGGRYDNLVSAFTSRKLPGVGVTIGLTRILNFIFSNNLLKETERERSFLVAVPQEEVVLEAMALAEDIRRFAPAEVYAGLSKLKKQIEYGNKKHFLFMVFPPYEQNSYVFGLKNLETGEQVDFKSREELLGYISQAILSNVG